jgi:hypothetical protein
VTVINVRCGDDLRDMLAPAGFDGEYLRYVDPVAQGPLPATDDPDEFDAVRAEWISTAYRVELDDARAQLAGERAALKQLGEYDRIRLWFEHDWFDQAILIRLLAELAHRPSLRSTLSLISIDRFPGIADFQGFGQLTAAQLASVAGAETPVTPDHLDAGTRAWAALRSPDPTVLADLDEAALPFLAAAVRRHLAELPWTSDGLSLSERLCLRACASADTLPGIFMAHQADDPAPYLGDTMLLPVLDRLVYGGALELTGGVYRRTSLGDELLGGATLWASQPRWVGGVRVPDGGWHWDPTVRCPAQR